MLIGLCNLMEAPQGIGLTYKKILNLISVVQIKSVQNSQELVVIGCLTLNIIRENVLIHRRSIQLVVIVVKITMVSDIRGGIISLVLAKVVTKLEIVQT